MRKRVGIIKQVTCIGLIFLLSINSFASVVSDNDGSAFITKAEFDALKSSFQSQIDSYNNSIDSKIDGAIANYLNGIKIANEWEFYDISNFRFVTGFPATAPQGQNYQFNLERQSNKKALKKMTGGDIWYFIAPIANDVNQYLTIPVTNWGDYGSVFDVSLAPLNWSSDGTRWWYPEWCAQTIAPDISLDSVKFENYPGVILCAVEPTALAQQYPWDFADMFRSDDYWTTVAINTFCWSAYDIDGGDSLSQKMRPRSLETFMSAHPDIPEDWLRSKGENSVLWFKNLKLDATTIQAGDSEQEKIWKRELDAWRTYNQSYCLGLNSSLGGEAVREQYKLFVKTVSFKYVWKNFGEMTWLEYLDAKKKPGDDGWVVNLKELYEGFPDAPKNIYGSAVMEDEYNEAKNANNTKAWNSNTYGKGYLVDTKMEGGVPIKYLAGWADKIAAQVYYDTQIHTYSEVTGDGNKLPTNWDDNYSNTTTFNFNPTYDIKESTDQRQASTSTKNFNLYWKQSIYPYTLKNDNDDTVSMMLGRVIPSSQREIWTFDANNALDSTPTESGTVTIPASEITFTRSGAWNDNGVLTEKNDYIVQTGEISFPTYQIKQEQNSIYDLVNSNASTIANRPVKLSSGVLCAKVNDQRIGSKARFKLKIYNATSGMEVSGKSVNWRLSDDMFTNILTVSQGARLLASGTAQSGEMIVTEPFDSPNSINEVWLSVFFSNPNDNNYVVKVEEFSIS